MNFENPTQRPTSERKNEALDLLWFERFKEAGNFDDFEYLEGSKEEREKQKQIFFSETQRNPKLDYLKLETFDFENREEALLKLKSEILEKETNEVVKKVYGWRINEKLAQIRMLKSAKNGNDRRFSRYSKFIYGAPEKDIHFQNLLTLKREMESKKEAADEITLLAIKRIEEALDFGVVENIEKKNVFDKKEAEEETGDVELSANEIRASFIETLSEYGVNGWEVVIERDITGISVSQEKNKIRIPENRKLSELKLKGLIAHEIGTHVLRREKGERSKLKLLGLGLDRYLKGEEGVSTYREQKVVGGEDFAGFEGHFAISLATGIDGKKRDFREVFNIMRDYFFIKSKFKDRDKAWESAKTSAWNRCVRTFRGTSCEEKGACFTRDIVYREGNIGIWDLVNKNSGEVRRFSVGKYDPTNQRHIWIMDQLGISDEDLQTLEK